MSHDEPTPISRRLLLVSPLLAAPLLTAAAREAPPADEEIPCDEFTAHGLTFRVWRLEHPDGPRPVVLLMHEIKGLGEHVWTLARRLQAHGYSVYLPDLFKTTTSVPWDGHVTMREGVCIAKTWASLVEGPERPLPRWIQALAAKTASDTGRPVAAIGMCLTGNFALAAILAGDSNAAVLCQPGNRYGVAALYPSETFEAQLKGGGCAVLAMRFRRELIPQARKGWRELQAAFPEDSGFNITYAKIKNVIPKHSTLTSHFHDDAWTTLTRFLDINLPTTATLP